MFTKDDLILDELASWLSFPQGTILRVSTDTREDLSGALFVALRGERFDAHHFLDQAIEQGAAAIVVMETPSSEIMTLAREKGCGVLLCADTLTYYQELAKWHRNRFASLQVVALTGSCGKTSTKSILMQVLNGFGKVLATKANTNNHIGVPQNLLRLDDSYDFAILELGTNHPGEIARLTELVQPDVAVVTNVGAAHLEFLKDLDGVATEKSSIYDGLSDHGVAIMGVDLLDYPVFQNYRNRFKTLTFGENGADFNVTCSGMRLNGSDLKFQTPAGEFQVSWPLTGKHQALNAAATLAVVKALNLCTDRAVRRLAEAQLEGMRMKVEQVGGHYWINDAYNANPSSMLAALVWLAALDDLPGPLYLVLGDMLEGGENSAQEHAKIIDFARNQLKSAKLMPVGALMKSAAGEGFATAEEAAEFLKTDLVGKNGVIFLKGSRGIRLEKVMTALDK